MTGKTQRIPFALTIAGSDSSGGAGVQADLKTFTVLGVHGASVLTALTAQNTRGVTGVHVAPAEFVEAQMTAVLDDLDVKAIKTGMLANRAIVEAVARVLSARWQGVLVVDPVMVATSGARLLADDAEVALRERLIPLATLITPNLLEAATLLGCRPAESVDEMIVQGRQLLALGCGAVLMKGGHGGGGEAVDVLVDRNRDRRFVRQRVATANTHGTGCTLAAAIVAYVVRGQPLDIAVAHAKDFLSDALEAGAGLHFGGGHGPVDHLFRVRGGG